jgi:nucleoside-diphosphate-sugar epimerase
LADGNGKRTTRVSRAGVAGIGVAVPPASGVALAKPTASRRGGRHVVMTGYPGFIAKRLVRRLLADMPRARFTFLVEESRRAEAISDLASLPAAEQKRVHVTTGDVSRMDLGLAGTEIEALADVTHIFHLAAVQRVDASRELLEVVNVTGVRNVIAFAKELHQLERLVHFSSCLVSGDRTGVITEDELDVGQRFHTFYEETKLRGEKLMRAAMKDLPITVLRPSIVVGSSDTGEIDRFDDVYALAILVVASPVSVPLPLPGPGTAPLNLVPVDFLTKAAARLAVDPGAAGGTFHLVDPNPLSARHVYELIAKRAGKKVPKGTLTSSLAARILSLPGIDRLSRRRLPRLSAFDRFVVYNCAATLALLDGTGVACPRFDTYVDKLIGFVTDSMKAERARRRSASADPLDA